jgi:hypothetical protein
VGGEDVEKQGIASANSLYSPCFSEEIVLMGFCEKNI